MAYEKTRRKSFNPANITVNRGDAIGQFGQQAFSDKMQLIDTTQNLISTKLDEYIADQKLEGTELANMSEIITDKQTFTVGNAEDGYEEVTYDIPIRYERNESLIKTKWSANTYDEQIEKVYTDSLIGTVNELTMAEKNRMKMTTNYDDTVSDIKAKYEFNMREPLEAILETVPEQYKNFYDGSTKKLVTAAITELSNRQVEKRQQFFSATSKLTMKAWESHHTANFLSGEKDVDGTLVQLTRLDAELKNQKDAERHGVAGAKAWINEIYPAQKEMILLGDLLSPYFKVDYEDETSILRTIHNHNALEQMFNNESNALLFIDEDNNKVKYTLEKIKELGFNVDNVVNRNTYQSTISRAKELLKETYTKKNNSSGVSSYISRIRYKELGYRVDADKKTKVNFATELNDKDSGTNKTLVPEFVAYMKHQDGVGPMGSPLDIESFTNDNMMEIENSKTLFNYYTYVGAHYQVLPDSFNKDILSDLRDIIDKANKGEVNRDDYTNFINNPTNKLARNILMKNKYKDYKSITILDNIPDISPNELKMAQRIYETFSAFTDGNKASQRLANVHIEEYNLKKSSNEGGDPNAFLVAAGAKNIAELNEKIDTTLLDDYSSKLFVTDTVISRKFSQVVKRLVYEELLVSAESTQEGGIQKIIPRTVARVVKGLEANGIYGKSSFTVGRGKTSDPDEALETTDQTGVLPDKKEAYGLASLDKQFFHVGELNTPFPDKMPFVQINKGDKEFLTLNDEQMEWLIKREAKKASGGHYGRTKSYSFFQNDIIKQINLAKAENPQFETGGKLILGETVFLEPVSDNVLDLNKVLYRAVFYSSPNAEPIFMKNEFGTDITYSRIEIENKSFFNDSIETKVEDFSMQMSNPAKMMYMHKEIYKMLNPAYRIIVNNREYKLSEEKRKYWEKKLIEQRGPIESEKKISKEISTNKEKKSYEVVSPGPLTFRRKRDEENL